MDVAHDVIAAGRTIRVLSVLDAYTRECFAVEIGHRLCQPSRNPRGTTKNGRTAASTMAPRPSSHILARPRAMEKTQPTSAWKTPAAFPIFPIAPTTAAGLT